jgi:hypothetical protein
MRINNSMSCSTSSMFVTQDSLCCNACQSTTKHISLSYTQVNQVKLNTLAKQITGASELKEEQRVQEGHLTSCQDQCAPGYQTQSSQCH